MELRGRCVARLRDQAVLLPPERHFLRAAARIAYESPAYHGSPSLDVWLGRIIGMATRELLDEERQWARDGLANDGPGSEFYASFAGVLGMEPVLLRRGCVRFHALAYEVRHAFYDLVIEGKTFDTIDRERGESRGTIEARLERAVRALGVEPGQFPNTKEGGIDA